MVCSKSYFSMLKVSKFHFRPKGTQFSLLKLAKIQLKRSKKWSEQQKKYPHKAVRSMKVF